MRSGADQNSDNLRINRAYLRISDHCRFTIMVRVGGPVFLTHEVDQSEAERDWKQATVAEK